MEENITEELPEENDDYTKLEGVELENAIRALSTTQQVALLKLSENPSLDIPAIANLIGCGVSTVRHWRYDKTIKFRDCWHSIRNLSVESLPEQARYQAMQHVQTIAMRDIELAIAENGDNDSPARIQAIGKRRDAVYKLAGLATDSDSPTVSVVQIINQHLATNQPRQPEIWDAENRI